MYVTGNSAVEDDMRYRVVVISLPKRTLENNFALFKLEYCYLGWNNVQHVFLRYTEMDLKLCK